MSKYRITAQKNPMLSLQVLEATRNMTNMKKTKQRLRNMNERCEYHKNKTIMKKVLHKGYWRYKTSHFRKEPALDREPDSFEMDKHVDTNGNVLSEYTRI